MSMAHNEMINIRRLDSELLDRHKNLLWIYLAQRDDWVGQQKATILGAFSGDEARIFHDESGVQHAFCISQSVSVFSEKALTSWLDPIVRQWANGYHYYVINKIMICHVT
jgi:hypothetical protein